MEYEFVRDMSGKVTAAFSMGHEALGHWLNDEANGDDRLLNDIETYLCQGQDCRRRPWQHIGHEYTLWTDGDEVMVRANDLTFVNDELEEGLSYYDEESLSLCGSDDFLHMLRQYREFLQQS
ncbi:YacL family protein [Martelella alba]|uniref:UPF0231 family protein n=1 Tax=Martelella alba TaxID=2590451 RepID=A0ABY2SRE7_9HYPH|nr:YacL family protein [Martelella alba]TKI08787.1 UPF0231 family protein [Martelella alba]